MKKGLHAFFAGFVIVVTVLNCCWILRQRQAHNSSLEADFLPTDTIYRATLLFTGDWMQHIPQVDAARTPQGFDYSPSTQYVAPWLREADFTAINLETTLTSSDHYTGYPLFRSPIALAEHLKTLGIDAALLANNHCCDGGARGLKTTVESLNRLGIRHTGAFADSLDHALNRILYFSRGGIHFALLNYTYGTNGMPVPRDCHVHMLDTLQMASDLKRIPRRRVDCIIACLHWGNEYERRPNRFQKEIADFLRRQGVALIIGSHPHVIQSFEGDSSGMVFYSLGNFVSNQQKRYCDGGLIVRIHVEKHNNEPCRYRAEPIPVWVSRPHYQILPQNVADTLPMPGPTRLRYEQFLRDTYETLARPAR